MQFTLPSTVEVEVTREDFVKYDGMRRSGRYNMFDPMARKLTGLSKQVWIACMKHYDVLYQAYIEEYIHDEGPDDDADLL